MDERFLFIDSDTVKRYLAPRDVIDIVKNLWADWKSGAVIEGEHAFLPSGINENNQFLHIPACLPKLGILGFKWINCYMEPAPGYPFSHGNIVVFNDIVTGSPKALVSAADITAMRTAGGHGVAAARYLAGREVKTLSVIGNGSQAKYGIEGFLCEFPEIETVKIYCRRESAYAQLEKQFGGRVDLQYVRDCSKIGQGADVILVATSSPEVLLRYEYLEKGTTVIALDGFIDVDPVLSYKADKWFVGRRKTDELEIVDSGDMSHGVKLDKQKIYGEVADVISGAIPGRESEEEIIVYTHMGSGAYDIACAYHVYQKALAQKAGMELRL